MFYPTKDKIVVQESLFFPHIKIFLYSYLYWVATKDMLMASLKRNQPITIGTYLTHKCRWKYSEHPKRDLGLNGDKFLELVSNFKKCTQKNCYPTKTKGEMWQFVFKIWIFFPSENKQYVAKGFIFHHIFHIWVKFHFENMVDCNYFFFLFSPPPKKNHYILTLY